MSCCCRYLFCPDISARPSIFGSTMMFAPNDLNSLETFALISREMVMSDAARAVPTATDTNIMTMDFFWLRKDFLSRRNNINKIKYQKLKLKIKVIILLSYKCPVFAF
jgi:hypothetical protein